MAIQDEDILLRACTIQSSVPSPQAGGAIILPSNILTSVVHTTRMYNNIKHPDQLSVQLSLVKLDHKIQNKGNIMDM